MFESVDALTHTKDGRRLESYPISSLGAFGSGELEMLEAELELDPSVGLRSGRFDELELDPSIGLFVDRFIEFGLDPTVGLFGGRLEVRSGKSSV